MDDERPGGSKKGLRRDSKAPGISPMRFRPEQPVPPFLTRRRRRLLLQVVAYSNPSLRWISVKFLKLAVIEPTVVLMSNIPVARMPARRAI